MTAQNTKFRSRCECTCTVNTCWRAISNHQACSQITEYIKSHERRNEKCWLYFKYTSKGRSDNINVYMIRYIKKNPHKQHHWAGEMAQKIEVLPVWACRPEFEHKNTVKMEGENELHMLPPAFTCAHTLTDMCARMRTHTIIFKAQLSLKRGEKNVFSAWDVVLIFVLM